MIPVPGGVRVWLAAGHTDMRKARCSALRPSLILSGTFCRESLLGVPAARRPELVSPGK